MAQVHPEVVLDPSQLPETDSKSPLPSAPTRSLPKPLADFKAYVDSKCCYHSAPMEGAQLVQVYSKVAYKCQMKTLLEVRSEHWTEEPSTWNHETILTSTTLGRWFEDTRRDEKSRKEQALPQWNYLSRCVQCIQCDGSGRTETATEIIICTCRDGKVPCPKCKGGGKVHCRTCKGCGGFYHSVRLRAEWRTCITTWYCQNSFLPEKKIEKAQRTLFWSNRQQPWSKEALFDGFVSVLHQDETRENIQLRNSLKDEYQNKHLPPILQVNNRLRRVACTIERLDLEEVHHTLDEMYVNKNDSALGNTFRFCQFPVAGKGHMIYENDYPLNCCGCFGNRCACYSCCRCTIL